MRVSSEAREVINIYNLIQLGLTWADICEIPYEMAERLVMLQQEISKKEKADLDAEANKNKK